MCTPLSFLCKNVLHSDTQAPKECRIRDPNAENPCERFPGGHVGKARARTTSTQNVMTFTTVMRTCVVF